MICGMKYPLTVISRSIGVIDRRNKNLNYNSNDVIFFFFFLIKSPISFPLYPAFRALFSLCHYLAVMEILKHDT